MSKIKTITIVCQPGTKDYTITRSYNDLFLERIEDHTVMGEGFHLSHYIGKTPDNEIVFEVINAPIEVEYE